LLFFAHLGYVCSVICVLCLIVGFVLPKRKRVQNKTPGSQAPKAK
jgi:hypothetical protein